MREHNSLGFQCVNTYNSVTVMEYERLFRPVSGSSIFHSDYTKINVKLKPKKEVIKKKTEKKKEIKAMNYITNKKKLSRKIMAFGSLRASRKFSAFVTISFPVGFPDKSGVNVLNNFLTNMRIGRKNVNYIWVAERQKNGTIHFHMLINQFWNVTIVNRKVAKAIENEIHKEKLYHLNFNVTKYNGYDVKKINSLAHLKRYITKYVTKNDASFECRAWACDRVVSALFTSISCVWGEMPDFTKKAFQWADGNTKYIKCDFAKWYPLKHLNNNQFMKILEKINDYIFDNYEQLKSMIVNEIEELVKAEPILIESQQVLF